ncbi:MAG: tetratricopeptide repeat protein [Leeuwenhoekiella sp.]
MILYRLICCSLLCVLTFGQPLFSQQNELQTAIALFNKNKVKEAKAILIKLHKNQPNNLTVQEYLGDVAAQEKEWDDAIEYFEELTETQPNNAEYHFKLGGAYGMKALSGSKFMAITLIGDIKDEFTRASELDPKHIATRWALVEFYLQLPGIAGGSTRKAEKYANELMTISPINGYLSKGYIAESEEEEALAETYYKKALQLGADMKSFHDLKDLPVGEDQTVKKLDHPNRNHLNYQMGKVSAEYNLNPQLGISSLKMYIKNHTPQDGPSWEWAYYRLAQIYKNLNDKPSALKYIKYAIRGDSDFDEALIAKREIDAM